ncbi:MAG TPA: N-acyl homoserine lactonase family protein [Arenicellales bacterium]|nr:N-acyl homoserine lactonase family protein [Arenicellales bacterium]
MLYRSILQRIVIPFVAFAPILSTVHAAGSTPGSVRLYTMDCGAITLQPRAMHLFDDTDAYIDAAGVMSVPCFLVHHPDGHLIWDAGLSDSFAGRKMVDLGDGFTVMLERSLADQLEQLHLTPADVDLIAFSHHHFDHTGNARLFAKATYLLNRRELQWSRNEPFGVEPEHLALVTDANSKLIEHDYDVFGDGKVRILQTPGHTPGHQALMLKLDTAGTVILSGDLYHTRDNFSLSRVAAVNHSRAETLASFDRVVSLINKYGARIVIQHDPDDIAALPPFPEYLD